MNNFELKVPVLTRPQREALYRVWCRDTSVAKNYLAFRRNVLHGLSGDYIALHWKGMTLGIEKDGYTHS